MDTAEARCWAGVVGDCCMYAPAFTVRYIWLLYILVLEIHKLVSVQCQIKSGSAEADCAHKYRPVSRAKAKLAGYEW